MKDFLLDLRALKSDICSGYFPKGGICDNMEEQLQIRLELIDFVIGELL